MARDQFCGLVVEAPEADHCGQRWAQSAERSVADEGELRV